MKSLLRSLVASCLKANNIAVACREQPQLLSLLTQEKSGDDRNAKFAQDFKTLADVLIQEAVKYELSKIDTTFRERIHGEESNEFTNSLGQTGIIQINDDIQNTRSILDVVLDGNQNMSSVLASEVHKEIELSPNITAFIDSLQEHQGLDLSSLGVWIDPIDGTSQYIKGKEELHEGYPVKGLQVAKVLIGVFDLASGRSVIGVVGTPFSKDVPVVFGSNISPSFTYPSQVLSKENKVQEDGGGVVVVGSSESPQLLDKLKKHFKVIQAGGAGHKMMMVVEGVADIYINSTASVYYWDTCAPHAILDAVGGGVLTFKEFKEIAYSTWKAEASHADGILVYRDKKHLDTLKHCLQ